MTTDKLPKSAQKVAEAARALGLETSVVEMPASTRTAAEAAAACGCRVGQIVKSLVFRGRASGRPLLFLVSGDNRVDQRLVAAAVGEEIERPDGEWVRAETGFAIGGVPPFGHARRLSTFIDRTLIAYGSVWAAAGTPHCVMRLEAARLAEATSAQVIAVC
jgi:prolyl-tRNA editing enzyme YbaK/EbsC (Cys-tRNA(Pro) deacylase)